MTFFTGTPAAGTPPTPTLTVPTGVTAGMTALILFTTADGVDWDPVPAETGSTFTLIDDRAATNMRVTVWTGTGLVAGDTITLSSTVSKSCNVWHLYTDEFTYDVASVAPAVRGASSAVTTSGSLTPASGEAVALVALERTTATPTTVSSAVSSGSETVTQRLFNEQSGTVSSAYVGTFTASAAASRTGTITYSDASTNGYAALITTTPIAVVYAVAGVVTCTSTTVGTLTSRLKVAGTSAAAVGVAGNVVVITVPVTYSVSGTVTIVSGVSGTPRVTGKPGQGNEVLALFDPDEVLTEGRVTYYQFDLLDQDENMIGTLQGVEGGEVSIDAYSAVKGTGSLTVYTEPAYSDLVDGQPAFLGARITTLTGPFAIGQGTAITNDYLIAGEVDASDISLGDRVILTDSVGVLKEDTVFTVTSRATAFGFTNISFSPDAEVPTVATDVMFAVVVTHEQIADWLNVRIRPMIRIARLGGGDDPAGRLVPAGVFLCAAPVEEWTATGLKRLVELTDKLSILDQDIASGDPAGLTAYTALAGANIIDLVTDLIGETGERYPAIQPDIKVLTSPLVWDIGTTRLKVINDLLDAAGYFSLWCDGYGQYQATVYQTPAARTPVYESIAPFSDGPGSLMAPEWTRDRDIYSVPNRVLVVSQGDGTTAALTSIATNMDALSPYSFPSRGRWITDVEIGVEAITQSALDTIAAARLSAATSVTNQITLKHILLPDLHINSVIHFVNPDSGLDIYCYVVATSIPMDPTALCTTTMRVVA